ncbi:MAG: acetyltransferase [Pseudonocardia sp.]|nr:acetyltransferase [Pseudonocardia sp.]
MPLVTWRPVSPADFPLLARWLAQPHVARWWNHETSAEAVERDFGPTARGEEPAEDLLALLDGRPIGLAQRSRISDYPEDHEAFAALTPVPDGAMTIDYLIGEPEIVGGGTGTRMIVSLLESTWRAHPAATCVIVAVAAANVASWRACEKAGLARIAEGEMEPDNPVDDRWHVVHRIDRPACLRCGAPRDPADPEWAVLRDPGEQARWLCPACARRHVRDIEAKLDAEWW